MMASRNASPKPLPPLPPRFSTDTSFGISLNPALGDQSRVASSRTWSYASGDLDKFNNVNDIDDRSIFVQEYNRLAQKHGIRALISEDDEKSVNDQQDISPRRPSWFSRTFRRHMSAQSPNSKSEETVRSKHSVGTVAQQIIHHNKDILKEQDLQGLIRLCGKSFLYLPSEYAPCPLILPTSLRATAHYLIQNAFGVAGIFRIPGSIRVVNEMYDYYNTQRDGTQVAGTVRNPNLPSHITVTVHDVASAFKKFLANLPGGILGSLSLFDAFVAIESQLHGHSELERARTDKLRARLIALAVGTVKSQLRRELICAVFGLLCYLGQEAQKISREDGETASELMGYNAFGIIFGPLLTGDLLDSYTMKLADPLSGLFLSPASPPVAKKHRKKSSCTSEPHPGILTVNKVRVANDVTEMLITHWLEVVKNMRSLNLLRNDIWAKKEQKDDILKTSGSDPFVQKQPLTIRNGTSRPTMRHTAPQPNISAFFSNNPRLGTEKEAVDSTVPKLYMKRTRPNSYCPTSNQVLDPKPPVFSLSPMAKEPSRNNLSSVSQHNTNRSVESKVQPDVRMPQTSPMGVNAPKRLMQPTGRLSENFHTYPTDLSRRNWDKLQPMPQHQDHGAANQVHQAKGIDPLFQNTNPKELDASQSPSKSPQLGEEQPMGWLGDYLNHAEANRTPMRLEIDDNITISSRQSRLQTASKIQRPHEGLSAAEEPTQQVGDRSQLNSRETDLSRFQANAESSRQKLRRARSKTLSTPPARPWRSQEATNIDRKHARKSISGAVRAMAAMFDNAAKDSPFIPTPGGKVRVQRESKTSSVLSTYTVNPSPVKSNGSNKSDLNQPALKKLGTISKGVREGRLGGDGQHETPTRQPLRSLKGDNTDTLNTAQCRPETTSSATNCDSRKPLSKSFVVSDQTRVHDTGLSKPSESVKPVMSHISQLVSNVQISPDMGGQITLHGDDQSNDTYIGDLRRRLHAKENECSDLRLAMGTRDKDTASLKEQLQRAKAESNGWKQRAEVAEKRVKAFVTRATKIKEMSRSDTDKDMPPRARLSLQGSPHHAERSPWSGQSQDRDGLGRASGISTLAVDGAAIDSYQRDTSSEWSGGTVVRTTPDKSQKLWMAVDELLEFATGTVTELEYLHGRWP